MTTMASVWGIGGLIVRIEGRIDSREDSRAAALLI
jgi:hypothetical protein